MRSLVGVHFADRGRDRSGADCWGLVRLAYLEAGIELPSLADGYATATDRDEIARLAAREKGRWFAVQPGDEKPLDVVLIRIGGRECHCGIVTEPGEMLHVLKGCNAVIESYRTRLWARRVAGFWRLA